MAPDIKKLSRRVFMEISIRVIRCAINCGEDRLAGSISEAQFPPKLDVSGIGFPTKSCVIPSIRAPALDLPVIPNIGLAWRCYAYERVHSTRIGLDNMMGKTRCFGTSGESRAWPNQAN